MRTMKLNLEAEILKAKVILTLAFITGIFILITTNAAAQSFSKANASPIQSFGVKTFANFSNVKVSGLGGFLSETKSTDGFDITGFIEIPLVENFSLQPELSYNKKGFKVSEGIDLNLFNIDIPVGLEAHTEVHYLQAPILGKYTLQNKTAGLYFMAGPSIAMATNATLRTKARLLIDFNITRTDINLSNDNFNRFELAALAGMGGFVNIGNARLFAEVRHHWGLTDLMADPIVDVQLKNRALGLGVGLQFNL